MEATFEDAMFFSVMGGLTAFVIFLCAGLWRVRLWERRRPSPEVDPEEVRRLAGELRVLARRVADLVPEEPAEAKERVRASA